MELLKVGEFASRYNLSISKVRAMCQTGELPALKIGVGWRINVEMAEEVLSDLFSNNVAHKGRQARQSRQFKAKIPRKTNFLDELARLRGC